MKPTLYLTNPAGLKAGRGGPGRPHLITLLPPAWLLSVSAGLCLSGTPPHARLMLSARKGTVSLDEYERACRSHWSKRPWEFEPGQLRVLDARPWVRGRQKVPAGLVEDGDTLLCVCGAGQPCHRRWLAEVLHEAGWQVQLDGAELVGGRAPPLGSPEEKPPRPSRTQPGAAGLQLSLLALPPSVEDADNSDTSARTTLEEPIQVLPSSSDEADGSDISDWKRSACPESPPETLPPTAAVDTAPPVDEGGCGFWRVIAHAVGSYLGGVFDDLPGRHQEGAARALLARKVEETGVPWRLYWVSATGSWSQQGLPLYPSARALRVAA